MDKSSCTEIRSAKSDTLFDLIADRLGVKFERILIVGCGAGDEAIGLSLRFDAESTGIDVAGNVFKATEDPRVTLRTMDACHMEFPDSTFDLVYSFHALEHIQPLDLALAEMRRVLKPNGSFCVGTPNKSRVVGYLGSPTTLRNKLRWNFADWKMRATRCWKNELGAHAGFTRFELKRICMDTFGDAIDVTDYYYRELYGRRIPKLISGLLSTSVKNYVLPAVYFVGHRHS